MCEQAQRCMNSTAQRGMHGVRNAPFLVSWILHSSPSSVAISPARAAGVLVKRCCATSQHCNLVCSHHCSMRHPAAGPAFVAPEMKCMDKKRHCAAAGARLQGWQ